MGVVYKYCKQEHGVDILETLQLKVTPPNQFNDPFEFAPHPICSNPMRRTKEIWKTKKHLNDFYDAFLSRGVAVGSRKEFFRDAKKHRSEYAAIMAKDLADASAASCRELLNNVSKNIGLLCLSRTNASILMWGHYTNSHGGLVIGFDSSNQSFSGLQDVKYNKQRLVFDGSWRVRDGKVQEFSRQIILWKNDEWSYEKEVRGIVPLNLLNQRQMKDGTIGFFLNYPPEAVVNVALGFRSTPELEAKVKAALDRPKLKHVKLLRAALHETEFKMVVA